jgi:predicted ATPase
LASRMLGHVRMLQGAFSDARTHLKDTLAIYDPARGIEVKRGQTADSGIIATVLLGLISWQFGEVEGVGRVIEQAKRLADESQHGLTLAVTYFFASILEMFRGDAETTLRDAEILTEIAARIEVPFFSGLAKICRGWARAQAGDRDSGSAELRQGLAELAEQKALLAVPTYQGLLAELEAEGPSAARALAQIDEALALAQRTGQLWTNAFLHRIRGDILLKANPANPDRGAAAYLAAIAIAREQGARSYGLQAVLRLANLYQSSGSLVEAHDVLAPALKSFSPTPEMPEIAEAMALMERLA